MRMTSRQKAVRDALAASGRFMTAQDLHDRLGAAGQRVGLTTVYRTLRALAGSGDADVVQAADGDRAYRVCGSATHHHHLICRICGETAEIPGAALERWAADAARRHGYADVTHTAEIFGICPACSASAAATQSAGAGRAAGQRQTEQSPTMSRR
jgi:Fur family ferric uptake transcriptional regulator